MIISHIILGVTLVGFAVWLQWTERRGWPNESFDSELDASYFNQRMRWRRRVNAIFAICGVLILSANVAGPRWFVIAWMLVILGLLAVMVLAGFDAIRTHRYMNEKVPELRRRVLEDNPVGSNPNPSDPNPSDDDG